MLRINSEVLFTMVAGTSLLIGLGTFIVVMLLQQQKRRFRHQQELQQFRQSAEQTLLQSQLEIKEQTLSQISRELHDNFGQIASLIKINLITIPLNDPLKAAEKIEHTKDLTRQLITDLKKLSVSLNGDRVIRLGLSRSLEAEVDNLNNTGVFQAIYIAPEKTSQIDDDKTIILYRMAQEILNNMVKHSKATQVEVSLMCTENLITLAFNDNGVGFNVEEVAEKGHGSGLQNLYNRARFLNANLHVESIPGNGCRVTIQLPFSDVS